MPRGGRGSHSTSVPVPLTQSALDARKSFYCELCGKGYGRMNEFEAHESSYDHQHKKRFMEMKQMQRGASSVEARRERERRAEEKAGLITIKPIKPDSESGGSAGKDDPATIKKGFRSAFATVDSTSSNLKQGRGFKKAFASAEDTEGQSIKTSLIEDPEDMASDTDEEQYSIYDPAHPTL